MRIRQLLLTIVLLTVGIRSFGQDNYWNEGVYQVKPWLETGVVAGATLLQIYGLKVGHRKPSFSDVELASLNKNDVRAFDRGALRQTYNKETVSNSLHTSDLILRGSWAAPFLLLIDKQIRKDWRKYLIIYGETAMLAGNLQTWVGTIPFDRTRPVSYYEEVPVDSRKWHGNRNSFFSGHVCSTAASTFFIAKTVSDYKGLKGWSKAGLYTAAALPPAVVGYYRFKGLKHFRSDLIIGYVVGAACGILIPELHRKDRKIAVLPSVINDSYCLNLTWKVGQ